MTAQDALAARKAALRKEAYARRKAAHAALGVHAPAAVRAHLAACAGVAAGRIVAGYRPIRTELDPTPAMVAAYERGQQVCVPVIVGAGQPLVFRAWWPGVAMEEGPFGAEVPVGTWTVEPDVLLVPLVAFDARCVRLGYGGGFYDRTLAGLRARGAVFAVGVAYGAQGVAELPHDPHDQPLDAMVTEAGLTMAPDRAGQAAGQPCG